MFYKILSIFTVIHPPPHSLIPCLLYFLEEMEAKRRQREAEAQDLVKKKFERAQEEKKKKMEAYKHQAPTHERDSKYLEVTQNLIQEKYK